MDYQPADFCIVSIIETQEPGMYDINLRSRWRDSPSYTVSQEIVEYALERVVMCPPGYPNPPEELGN